MTVDELPPSRLGTKEHWDNVYEYATPFACPVIA